MKPMTIAVLLMMALGDIQAGSPPPRDPIRLDGRVNYPAISSHGGRLYLQLSIAARDVTRPARKPLNLSIVLDRSGSMAEEGKMSHARAALHALINQLRHDDVLSLVIYDNEVDVLWPASPLGRRKDELRRLVNEVYPRGRTNLGGGLSEGYRQVGCNLQREYVNRVILLSDGLANEGVTDPGRLGGIAQRERISGVSLTTIGVGLDYNENLMVDLSEQGGGNYYFIENPENLASVLRREFDQLSSMLAQSVVLELELGGGVTLHDVIGFEYHREGAKVKVPIGDLYANDSRELCAEISVPPGKGSLIVANGKLVWQGEPVVGKVFPSFRTSVRYESDQAAVERERDWDTQAKGDVAVSTRAVKQAMEALDAGKTEEATATLTTARRDLAASPAAIQSGAAAGAIKEQEARLKSYADSLSKESKDTRKVKKSIQYDNYQVQKQR
jgi:Ca-activated chloride channel family protein